MNSIPIPNNILIPQVEELIKRDKEVIIRAKGNSMLPYIKDGKDSVVLAQPKDLAVGDIVLARVQERFVMHRIISITGKTCTMMGDGNIRGTEVFCKEDAIGKVIWLVQLRMEFFLQLTVVQSYQSMKFPEWYKYLLECP